jgi:transposase
MTRRHELSDPEWAEVAGFFPANGKPGGQFNDHRTLINGVFWHLRTGEPWRDVPERYGPGRPPTTASTPCGRAAGSTGSSSGSSSG